VPVEIYPSRTTNAVRKAELPRSANPVDYGHPRRRQATYEAAIFSSVSHCIPVRRMVVALLIRLASAAGTARIGRMLEICIDGVASARAALAGGADRVELCANLPEGGTTPSAGMIREVRAAFRGGLMVIIRPRGYDFLYSGDEMSVMLQDVRVARELGADGIVIGCLTADGRVDREGCGRLLEAARGMDVTFHRAFDMSRDLPEALEDIVSLGIRRVLTSGGAPDVPAGQNVIRDLVKRAVDRISIMPGGGVTEANLGEIVRATGVREIHLSARAEVRSGMTFRNERCGMGTFSNGREYQWREASEAKVRAAKQALTAALAGR
jgi:copper homeostasis protein